MKKKLFSWFWRKKLGDAKVIFVTNWRFAGIQRSCGNKCLVCMYWFPWEKFPFEKS